jgi:peptide/nickel transport system permease protein
LPGGRLGFALRRLGFYLLAAWVAVTVNFLLPRLMPGDPATALFARFRGRLAPEAIVALREAFGLRPAPIGVQYLTYLKHILHGDFGMSIAYFPTPVSHVLVRGLTWTLFLSGTALVISFSLGTLLGIFAAWRRGGFLDRWGTSTLSFLGAFPYFWLAMLAVYVLGYQLRWLPVGGAYDDDTVPGWSFAFVVDVARHAALPVSTVVLATMGGWMLTMRNAMISTNGAEYVRLAYARGLSPNRVLFQYAARNALVPSLASFGMALGFVLGGSLLTEVVFSYPGQGYLLVQAVRAQDYPLMQGIFLVITLSVLAANWVVDVVVLSLDPRTRSGEAT